VNQHHVVTSAHVIPCCKKVTVYSLPSCSNAEVVTIVATEQKNDLGLLRLDRPLKHYATLRSGKELQLGEAVSTYDRKPKVNGCPQYDVGQGNVTELNWMPNDSRIMVHDSPTHKGSSGGPVLDASGHIVGVTRAVIVNTVTNRQRSAAVKSHLLKAFLKSNNVEYKTALSNEKLSLSEIKKKSDKFTVQIKCLQ
jgi:S1-C subfamily serine protease